MILKYDIDIDKEAILKAVDKITNQIFKLLPSREEGGDWESPLTNLIVDLKGMSNLLSDHTDLFPLLCKLEALKTLTKEEDFIYFRKTIFECLGLCNVLKEEIQK